MKKQKAAAAWFCSAIYIALLAAILLYIVLRADLRTLAYRDSIRDFSQNWQTGTAESLALEGISAGNFGGSVTVERPLPETIAEEDELCFETQNANVTVWVADREVYRFEGRENLTGRGYGIAFHMVGLSSTDAGQIVRIRLDSVLDTLKGGRIWQIRLCPSADYIRMLLGNDFVPCILSVLIIFFGLLLVVVYFWLPDKKAMPYDICALGAAALLIGAWCLNDTYIPLLLTGHIYTSRVLDKMLLPLVNYPLTCFSNSLTRQKRPIYRYIALGMTMLSVALLLGLRYGLGLDMISLTYITYPAYACTFLLSVTIFADNARYCKKNGLRTNLSAIYLGTGVFMACAVADILRYYTVSVRVSTHGILSRFGMTFFVLLMLLQFLRWWSGEHATIERNQFINRALQYAVSANDPEVNIRVLLRYLGTELHAKRANIFEKQDDGTYRGTYEWFAEGTEPMKAESLALPYEGLIDGLYKEFKRSNRLIVENIESYHAANPAFRQVLRENKISSVVVGPLEANGELNGFFSVGDAPRESLTEISEIIRLISYFFEQLILQREEQKRLTRYSYFDSLTGARNRRAFTEFEENGLDRQASYGFVMCDINGLKAVNDQLGHKAGDEMIIDVAQSLIEVFGTAHVYRIGGDEFAAYGFEADEASFDADVERVKALIAQKGRTASIGAVFCADGTAEPAQVRSEADARMYREKERYYAGKGDRRRH
ncbi:MAG: GGDEF domain-containing protein [Ruminococcaceae bacterium]|nr:GGDEF domain-containing protein [Oscillospiraceae bacterium]